MQALLSSERLVIRLKHFDARHFIIPTIYCLRTVPIPNMIFFCFPLVFSLPLRPIQRHGQRETR